MVSFLIVSFSNFSVYLLVALSLNLPSEIPSSSPVENGISSPDNSTTSSPENLTKKPPSRSSHHSSSQPKHAGKHNMTSKPESKLSPTSHHADALKKTTKDLTRSSFSLARYQVLLEEVKCCFCLHKIDGERKPNLHWK